MKGKKNSILKSSKEASEDFSVKHHKIWKTEEIGPDKAMGREAWWSKLQPGDSWQVNSQGTDRAIVYFSLSFSFRYFWPIRNIKNIKLKIFWFVLLFLRNQAYCRGLLVSMLVFMSILLVENALLNPGLRGVTHGKNGVQKGIWLLTNQ